VNQIENKKQSSPKQIIGLNELQKEEKDTFIQIDGKGNDVINESEANVKQPKDQSNSIEELLHKESKSLNMLYPIKQF
jgi:hypothetical protein